MTVAEIKKSVRARDGFRCTKCGMTNDAHREKFKGRQLDVHRVVPGSVYAVAGCVALCRHCHSTKPKSPARRIQPPPRKSAARVNVGMRLTRHTLRLLDQAGERIGRSRGAVLEILSLLYADTIQPVNTAGK